MVIKYFVCTPKENCSVGNWSWLTGSLIHCHTWGTFPRCLPWQLLDDTTHLELTMGNSEGNRELIVSDSELTLPCTPILYKIYIYVVGEVLMSKTQI